MLKKLLPASAAILALSGSAYADHLRRPTSVLSDPQYGPMFRWTGFYVGVSGGFMANKGFDIETEAAKLNDVILQDNVTAINAGFRPSRFPFKASGPLAGGTLGVNFQIHNIVVGVEGDLSYTDMDKTAVHFNSTAFGDIAPGALRNTFRQDMNYFATTRLRAGFAIFDTVLAYGTIGAAIGDPQHTVEFSSPGPGPTQFFGQSREVLAGYAVGGGIEFAVLDNALFGSALTLKAEYLHYDLGSTTVSVLPITTGAAPGAGAFASHFGNEGHIVRAGVNFKFSGF